MNTIAADVTFAGGYPPPRASRFTDALARWPILQISPLLVFLVVAFVLPVSSILVLSVFDESGAWTLHNFERLFGSSLYVGVLLKTLKIASIATATCLLLGYPVAFALTKSKANFKAALLAAVLFPLWTSFLIRNLSLIIIFGRRGFINEVGHSLGLIDQPISFIYNLGGVLIGMCSSLMPLCIITMYSVMQSIDANLAKAASTLGGRPAQGFWRVFLPLSLPGVAAAAILTFVNALGFFITPQLLGSASETMISQLIIEQINGLLNWNFGAAMAVMLLAATLISFFVFDRVVGIQILTGDDSARRGAGLGRTFNAAGMKLINGVSWVCAWIGMAFEKATGIRPTLSDKPRRPVLSAVALVTVLFLSLPIFFVIPLSFTKSALFGWPPQWFSLRWYEAVLGSSIWLSAAWRSLGVALISATFANLLAVPAALFLVRQKIRAKFLLILLLTVPIFLPHIITAVALYYTYSKYQLVGTWTGLVIGHMVFSLPYATISLMAVLKNYDRVLDSAAWTLGASRFTTFRYVTLPIIKPGVFAAFLFAFIQSFEEVTVALFVTGGSVATLPKQIYQQAMYVTSPILAAASTLLLLTVCALMIAARLLGQRSKAAAA